MRKNKLLNLALVGASLLAVTSCGTSSGYSYEINLPGDDPSSEVHLTFWHCLGHDKTDNLNKIVTSFNKKYDGKYEMELVKLAGDYDSLADSLKTKLASGEQPDLAMGYPDSFSEYITNDIESSNLLKLDNFINDPNVGYTEEEVKDFVPQYYAEGQNYQFEGTWSMPMYKSTEVMYYNRNYFDGANPANDIKFSGNQEYTELKKKVANASPKAEDLKALRKFVTDNKGYVYDIPSTWEEMFTLAKKMKADNTTEGVTSEFYPVGYDSDANMFISQFAQRGIDYTTNEGVTNKEDHILFKNDKAKEFTKEIMSYINDGLMITKGSLGGDKYTNTYFNDMKMAMSIGSTGGSSYQISANFGVGLAPVPYKGTKKYIQQGPSICFFNNNDGYRAKGAWLFYKELADPTNNAKLALENSYDPIRISSYETKEYKNWISLAGSGLNYDIPAITSTLKDNYMTSPVFIGSATARTEIGKIITYVKNQHLSIDQAFDSAYNTTVAATK